MVARISRRDMISLNPILEEEILMIGNRFHGAIAKFFWQPIHLGCSRLCVEIGQSGANKDK